MKCFLIFLCVIGVSLEANAQNWSRTNGPVEDNVHDLCIDSNGVLYALTPLGVNRSTDGGEHWTRPFVFPVTSTSGQIMVMSSGLILVSTSSNLFILKDSAGALVLHTQPNVAGRFRQFASAADGRIFGAHLTKLMYSHEDVSAWKPVIADGDLIENPVAVTASNDTVVTHNQWKMHFSFNNGSSWVGKYAFDGSEILKLMILPNGVLVCLSDALGLLHYDWSTEEWLILADFFSGSAIYYTADAMHDGAILVSSSAGIHLIKDTAHWVDFTVGFGRNETNKYYQVTKFIHDTKQHIYYAATLGAGVWKSAATLLNVNTKTSASSFHVTPNPAQDRVTIEYIAPEHRLVTLKLYDMLGRTVWKRTETAVVGQNVVSFDAKSLLPGSYLIVLEICGEMKTHWVTIL